MMFRDTVRALSTPRERRIIALRYLNGKTQTQVAKEIGISQAQVSRLEKAALNHIKGTDLRELSFNYQKCFVGANIVPPRQYGPSGSMASIDPITTGAEYPPGSLATAAHDLRANNARPAFSAHKNGRISDWFSIQAPSARVKPGFLYKCR